jgi:hypothetical protein
MSLVYSMLSDLPAVCAAVLTTAHSCARRHKVEPSLVSGALQPGQGGFHFVGGSSLSFVEFQFALLYNKEIRQPFSLSEEMSPRLNGLKGTVASQTPHHGWGHTFRFARRL